MIFFQKLSQYKNLIHGVLERKDGSVNPFSVPKTEENILKALEKIGYKNFSVENLIFAEQVHGNKVYFCPPKIGGYIKLGVDGLISETTGQILIIYAADCLPILIYDPKRKRIGAIHAGKKGLIKGIIENAIATFETDPASLIIGIGPHIRSCCYDLREDAEELKNDPQIRRYISKRNQKIYLDLTKIAIDKLLKLGVKEENIEDCKICTFCEARRFYSCRKQLENPEIYKKEGVRMPCFGSFIGLVL